MAETPRLRRHAARSKQILDVAVTIAEREGWAAVTTRRLADEIGFSQPVIYQHFASRDALVDAVVQRGFSLLTDLINLHAATGQRSVACAYVTFGRKHRALYEAMFARPVDMPFASADTPDALRAAFTSLEAVIDPHGTASDRSSRAELFWASCHGLVSLSNSGRIPAAHLEQLITNLIVNASSQALTEQRPSAATSDDRSQ